MDSLKSKKSYTEMRSILEMLDRRDCKEVLISRAENIRRDRVRLIDNLLAQLCVYDYSVGVPPQLKSTGVCEYTEAIFFRNIGRDFFNDVVVPAIRELGSPWSNKVGFRYDDGDIVFAEIYLTCLYPAEEVCT